MRRASLPCLGEHPSTVRLPTREPIAHPDDEGNNNLLRRARERVPRPSTAAGVRRAGLRTPAGLSEATKLQGEDLAEADCEELSRRA